MEVTRRQGQGAEGTISLKSDGGNLYSTVIAFLQPCYCSRVAGGVSRFFFLVWSYFVGGFWMWWVVYLEN